MALQRENLSLYLTETPQYAHEIAHRYNHARSHLSPLERIAVRLVFGPTSIDWRAVDAALKDAPGIERSERFYWVEWDARSNECSPMTPGQYPLYRRGETLKNHNRTS